MAVDSYARILAYAALDAAESGGGGSKGIDNVYILDGHLHIVYSTGDDIDVGQVVGAPGKDGKVYEPSIFIDEDGRRILHWELKEKDDGQVPEDIVLGMERAEWTDPEPDERGDKYSDIAWGDFDTVDDPNPEHGFSGDDNQGLQSKAPTDEYVWDTL